MDPVAEPEPVAPEPEPAAPEPVGLRARAAPEPEPVAYEPEPPPDEPPPEPEPPVEEPMPEPDPEPPVEEPEPEPEPIVAAAPVAAVGTTEAERRTVHLPRPQTEGPIADTQDRPSGIRRARRNAPADYKAQPGAPGMPPHRSLGVQKRRRRLRRTLPLLIGALVLLAALVFAFLLFQPLHGKGDGNVAVRDPAGLERRRRSATCSTKAKVVDSRLLLRPARPPRRQAQQAARRDASRCSTTMTYGAALDALTTPPARRRSIDVHDPRGPVAPRDRADRQEGRRQRQLPQGQRRARRSSSRDATARRAATRTLEGFLFPATYELRRADATAKTSSTSSSTAFKKQLRAASA